MKPLISVIVPIYNIKPYLRQCVDTILAQTYKNLEIILVNDESTDGCAEICDEYGKKDKRILVLHKKNGGLSDARNAGMKIAKGELFAFIDGDDYISPTMYEAMYSQLEKHNADLATCRPTYHDAELSQHLGKDIKIVNVCSGYDAIKYLYNDYVCGNYAWNKLYKRHLFDNIEFPFGKHFEDIPIMHEVFNRAKKAVILDEKFYLYRVREDQITNGEFVPFHTLQDHISAFETRLASPVIKGYEKLTYSDMLNCLKRCKRLAIQNKVKDANKKDVIKFVNKKIREDLNDQYLTRSERLQKQALLHFNHIAILYRITRIRQTILGR